MAEPARSLLDLVGNTPLVELPQLSPKPEVKLYAKLEGQNPTGSIKDRVALAMVEAAELEPGQELLEPTSGNTGISLALVARLKGYRLTCVMPENVTEERRRLLRLYGAEIIESPGAEGSNGAVRVAQELAEREPRYRMLFQYANEANPQAHYEGTGAEIAAVLERVDVLVAGLRALLDREGVFAGVSSGAVVHAARKLAAELDEGVVVAVLADAGWKYLSAPFWDAADPEAEMEEAVWW